VKETTAKSRQTPFATTDMDQQSRIAQDLKLLADFVADVAIIGMEFFQFAGEGVGVHGCKLGFSKAADGVEYVQRPATLGDGNFFQWFYPLESVTDFGCRGNPAFGDNEDAGFGGNAPCANIKNRPVSVMAGIECLFMPFGTVLGVFTILVLVRESVKPLFGVNLPTAPANVQ